MKYFSLVHKLQTPVAWLKGLALLTIAQLTSCCMFSSSKFQIYFDKAVAFLGFLVLKLDVWLRHLALKLVAVNPMYVSVTPSPLLIVAWYTTDSVKHLFCTGHSLAFLQSHSFLFTSSPCMVFASLKSLELCPLMVLAKFLCTYMTFLLCFC